MLAELSKLINELPEKKEKFKQTLNHTINKRLQNKEEKEKKEPWKKEKEEKYNDQKISSENENEKGMELLNTLNINRPEIFET